MTTTTMDSTVSRPPSGIVSTPRPMRSRTQSISSDRPSTIAHSLMSPPLSITPEAAFIAASAASQIVTNDHDSHADKWYDEHGIEPANETVLVSPGALQLVNNFLDQLLFNFLSVAQTTSLTALRPAVSEVLKPKLAKDAINQADEELREYLGGGDEEDLTQPLSPSQNNDWDLELIWKRTRLRCMVYSSLGDMEEEDEDYYMEQDNLDPGMDERTSEVISPAVAIFLTSILEFMGEQALIVAGQASYHRMRSRHEKDVEKGARSPTDVADRIVVEELDMERVALDRTLGRLWRAWKKRIRSPILETGHRPFSRDSARGSSHRRQGSLSETPLPTIQPNPAEAEAETSREAAELTGQDREEQSPNELETAAGIPLPLSERDVDEIEVPGLIYYSDEDEHEGNDEGECLAPRPRSLMIFSKGLALQGVPTPTPSQPQTPTFPRKRSNSLPTPSASLYAKISKPAKVESTSSTENGQSIEDSLETSKKTEDSKAEEEEAVEDPEKTPRKLATRPAKIVTGTGVAVIATASSKSQSRTDSKRETTDPEEYEPEIMTSARVSIGGRSSPAISDSGRPLSTQFGHPQRSPSVHSARIIEVAGPKSPRSRNSSVDTLERQRPSSLSRTSSVSTPTIAEEHRNPIVETVTRGGASSPVIRSPIARPGMQNPKQSISEIEEDVEGLSARVGSTPTTASLWTPNSVTVPPEELNSQIKQSQAIFGSVVRSNEDSLPRSPTSTQVSLASQREQPSSPQRTKVSILSTSSPSGAPTDKKQDSPKRSPVAQTSANPYPEWSATRSVSGTAATIGVLSIERTSSIPEHPELQEEYNSIATSTIAPRQIHTSGSSGSSGNGSRIKPVRTSEDSSKASVARNFEELIHSDQTITYTLTPESMRDMDSSPVRNRRSEEARVNGDRARLSGASSELKRTPSVSVTTGLHSHPVPKDGPGNKLSGPVPRNPAGAGANRTRMNAQARDARVPRESVMDIAEFIRSTGPAGDNSPAPLRSLNGPVPSVKSSLDSHRISSHSNRPRLQARDASTDNREDSSDLIDFIRRGPPSGPNNPRIPRTVAPFRTTMDSDQMSGAVNLGDSRYSQASTNVTVSSTNSQSALLRNKPSHQNNRTFDEEGMMPKRKTRRVRDPYALDFSDEEEDDYGRPAAPPAKEESLADFLRNYAPPPEPVSPSTVNIPQKPKKKISTPSLMSRLGRSSSSAQPAPEIRPVSNRTSSGRGYIPIQVNMPPGYDRYGQVDPAATTRTTLPPASAGRVPMRKYEPREAVSTSSRTSDLADFLRNSEPPATFGDGNSNATGRRKKAAYAS